uniref:Uncharacterized protein n=1 Tax=Candidatus Kentrum sp. FM TaxID=2126340 RepID=A0A450SB62_9GAMM|nr:MAG: hypothetical protein BECKFM1743A_GA0114220_1006512 [Candidatus Kentron sp. FM]VFJ49393.1 MAG: hypothetical protein BECKFM1743C_GA0114222_1007012 [Candidatus Kentron sp. FM]VFK08285.1 MAG: hypothetical protein BECKFM1743B_GA0114221_1006412 [Candidatus Kentron sp. FM]
MAFPAGGVAGRGWVRPFGAGRRGIVRRVCQGFEIGDQGVGVDLVRGLGGVRLVFGLARGVSAFGFRRGISRFGFRRGISAFGFTRGISRFALIPPYALIPPFYEAAFVNPVMNPL